MILKNLPIAIPFKIYNDTYNEITSEFNLIFDKKKNRLEKLIEFVDMFPNKRINITFSAGIEMSVLTTLEKLSDNIYCCVTDNDFMHLPQLKEKDIKFFFDSSFLVYNWSTLDSFIDTGVTDVYIGDDLLYDLPKVSEYCQAKDINIRLVLNKIPSTTFDRGSKPTDPFFRPEDTRELVKYIDTFEFDCGDPYDWNKFQVYYTVFFERGTWIGQMSELNSDVRFDFPNATILPEFSWYKMRCNHKCVKQIDCRCRKCWQFTNIAKDLRQKDIRIVTKSKNLGQD